MAKIDCSSFKLGIEIKSIDLSHESYNTTCVLDLYSEGFSGITEMVTSYTDLLYFANNLKDMYEFLKGVTKLIDYDYGTSINVSCDESGYFVFEGVILNGTSNELRFKNRIDQSYIKNFINNFFDELEKAKQ